MAGAPIPILYVQMDGTGIPVVKKETVGRQGKIEGQPAHTREVKLDVCSRRPSGEPARSWLCAVLISMAALRITGRTAAQLWPLNSNFYVAHPRTPGSGTV